MPVLQARGITYSQVIVKSVTPRSIFILHAKGMASIPLSDLEPELQRAFGYDPVAASILEKELEAANATRSSATASSAPNHPPIIRTQDSYTRLLQSFSQVPRLYASVDLRPRFFQHGLFVKNQGKRPSCAVFAIVSALEYLYAEKTGKTERFSEEYLIWATAKILDRPMKTAPWEEAKKEEENGIRDTGFGLYEVVNAVRAYGVPPLSQMPYRFLKELSTQQPPAEVIAEASRRKMVGINIVPGRDKTAKIANIIHALNQNVPVPVGLYWPAWQSIRHGYLSKQIPQPDSSHAVTLVGYKCESGQLEDAVFLFKNSWGNDWGVGGFGQVTYEYLLKNLISAVLLEVRVD